MSVDSHRPLESWARGIENSHVPRSSRSMKFITEEIQRLMRTIDSNFPLKPGSDPLKIRIQRQGLTFRPRYVNEWFMALGLWEPYVVNLLNLRPGDVFFDVGAHIGYFSRIAGDRIGPTGLVVAIEPDPRNLPLLMANTSCYPQVTVVPKACGRTEGTTRLLQDGNPLWSEINAETPKTIEVDMTTLDNCVKELPAKYRSENRKYFAKIDVEKAELSVIRGGQWFVDTFKPEMVVEAFPDNAQSLSGLLPRYNLRKIAESYFFLSPMMSPL